MNFSTKFLQVNQIPTIASLITFMSPSPCVWMPPKPWHTKSKHGHGFPWKKKLHWRYYSQSIHPLSVDNGELLNIVEAYAASFLLIGESTSKATHL